MIHFIRTYGDKVGICGADASETGSFSIYPSVPNCRECRRLMDDSDLSWTSLQLDRLDGALARKVMGWTILSSRRGASPYWTTKTSPVARSEWHPTRDRDCLERLVEEVRELHPGFPVSVEASPVEVCLAVARLYRLRLDLVKGEESD